MTFTGGLRHNGMTAPRVPDGPMDGPAFITCIKARLAPILDEGDVVVPDNLPGPQGRRGTGGHQGARCMVAVPAAMFTDFERRRMAAIRAELDKEYEAPIDRDKPNPKEKRSNKLSRNSRTGPLRSRSRFMIIAFHL